MQIHEINDRKLTFVVPTGTRVFLRSTAVTADPKQESDQTDGYEMKEPQKTDVSMTEAPELGTLKEEPPMNDSPKKEELQSIDGLQDTDQDPRLEDIESECKQEDLVTGEALELPANPESKPHNENGSVQVVIVSPQPELNAAERAFKRPTPLPAVEPSAKRKRGRPRKIQLSSPEPEAEAVPALAHELEPERESGVQVVIGAGSSALPRTEPLSQIDLPAPSPGAAPVSSINHGAMDMVNIPRKAEPEPENSEPMSSPRPIIPSSPLSEASEGLMNDHTEEPIEKPTEQPPREPSEELVALPTEEHTEEPIKEAIKEPTEVPVEEPMEVSTREPTQEHIKERVEDSTQPPSGAQTTVDEPDEIIVPDISSPMVLVKLILQIDGRRPDGRTANSWKEIRCYRKNQDMGSLFDVRQAWYLKQK